MNVFGKDIYTVSETSNKTYEMATVSKVDTGLAYDVMIDSVGANRREHDSTPRIIVMVDVSDVLVSIEDNPRILFSSIEMFEAFDKVSEWIIFHKDILIRHWHNELTDKEALNLLGTLRDG